VEEVVGGEGDEPAAWGGGRDGDGAIQLVRDRYRL
jgi:hypothetical protein